MQTYYCRDGCCPIKIKAYKHMSRYFNRNYRKAGVFIYDPKEHRVLLVQSRGHLWGPPKGTLNIGEREIDCAIREVKEETGLDILSENFTGFVEINNKAIYYYLEMNTCDIELQNGIEDNDANGITWIKIECLENAIIDGNIVLNHYAKIVFNKLLKKTFPKSDWTIIKRKIYSPIYK
jgi:8-oxo-dGTP pyrophosphatase MutT (NUDIX family)